MTHQRKSAPEWEWQDGTRHYAVSVFVSTRKLIWSGWIETADGPVFDDGFAQTFEEFERGGSLPNEPPPHILDDLHAVITEQSRPKRAGLFRRLLQS